MKSGYLQGPTIHSYSMESIGAQLASMGRTLASMASTVWPTANLALFFPFTVFNQLVVTGMFWVNGATANGNVDAGIYDAAGVKIISTGSTAQAGVTAVQQVAIAYTTLDPGEYYLALVMDNIVGTMRTTAMYIADGCATCGMAQMAAAFVLPVTATFAKASGTYLPIVGCIVAPRTTI